MYIYVISWFFPPVNSSEAVVTFKLLKHSSHEYLVCSSQSLLWSYANSLDVYAENVTTASVATDSIDEWADFAVETFEKEHKKKPFDAIMSRTMPPEGIDVARRIKEKFPSIPWIASLNDPVANNPYQLFAYYESIGLTLENQYKAFCKAQKGDYGGFKSREFFFMHKELYEKQEYTLNNANTILVPCDDLRLYITNNMYNNRVHVLPHSYDNALCPVTVSKNRTSSVKTLTFIGFSDEYRSLDPIVEAVCLLKSQDPLLAEKLQVKFIGNIHKSTRLKIYNYYVYDVIHVLPSVSYQECGNIMQDSDWMIHVDAYFDFLRKEGGTVFFAGKLADYFGTDKPILALTGKNSFAARSVTNAGGIALESTEIHALVDVLSSIANNRIECPIDTEYRNSYDASVVAQRFDAIIEKNIHTTALMQDMWPPIPSKPFTQKFISICIPSYNVQKYLHRCLFSLLSCANAQCFQIIIVNDGSRDETANIAHQWQQRYPSIIEVIDKENGGHGSTINAAMQAARGEYFRVIDGDDWVDSMNFDKLVEDTIGRNERPDIITSCYHQVYAETTNSIKFLNNVSHEYNVVYNFDVEDMSSEYFTMASCMFKTNVLKDANFKLQEKTFYVDVEFILFPIPFVKTVLFTKHDVYRYAIGLTTQSINPEVFVSRIDNHDRVVKRLVEWYTSTVQSASSMQGQYIETILSKHLILTHYSLCLDMNKSKNAGLLEAEKFDSYLRKANSSLYSSVIKYSKKILLARAVRFSPVPYRLITSSIKKCREAKNTIREELFFVLNTWPFYYAKKPLKALLKR